MNDWAKVIRTPKGFVEGTKFATNSPVIVDFLGVKFFPHTEACGCHPDPKLLEAQAEQFAERLNLAVRARLAEMEKTK